MTGTDATDWIGVDWGNTHLRAWAFSSGGTVVATRASAAGTATLDGPAAFEAALHALAGDLLRAQRGPGAAPLPVLVCGSAGAREGWARAGYSAVPCRPLDAAGAVVAPVSDRRLDVRILPGLSQARPPDTMRGEETQIAGLLAARPDFDGVVCLPGTETKWAHVSAGEVVSFRTFLTGSLFAALSRHSVLRHGLDPEGWDQTAFSGAVAEGMSRPQGVAAQLFSIRAEGLLHGLPGAQATARLSGLLIGMELAGSRPFWLGREVAIVGAPRLAEIYAEALAAQGVAAEVMDCDALTRAGLIAARGGAGFAE